MINTHTLNKIEIEPLQTSNVKKKNLLGGDYFDTLNYLLFISAKKKSGKTSLIWNIIKNTTDKNTKFMLFVSTHNVDKSWMEIKKYLTKRGNVFETFDSVMDGKVNNLEVIMSALNADVEEEEDEEVVRESGVFLKFDEPPKPRKVRKKKKKKKKKLLAPEWLFIFDDISQELKNPSIATFMKQHRHWGASAIISSQYVKDLTPSAVSQIDYFFTFKNFSLEKLLHIHKLLDLSIEFDDFLNLYYYATKEPFKFMYVNVRTEEIRKGFNTLIEIKKKDN